MIFILDNTETVVSTLNNDAPYACPYFNDAHTERLEDSLSTYQFEVPADRDEAAFLIAENFIARKDFDGNMLLFKIKTVTEGTHNGEKTKVVYCENAAIAELNGDIIRPTTLTGYAAPAALDYILQGTLWSRGQVDFLGVATINFIDYETALAGVHMLPEAYGGELRYRIEIAQNKIVRRYIDLLERRGSNTRKRFEYKKDIQGLERIEDSIDIATAIIPLGPADDNGVRMTIKSVNNNRDYLCDEAALAAYGNGEKHLFAVYIAEDADNPMELMRLGREELNKRKKPKYTYNVDVQLLERKAGLAHEAVRLGDTVGVLDLSLKPTLTLEARIIEIVRSYTSPENDSVVLGEFVEQFITLPEAVRRMQSQITIVAGQAAAAEKVHKGTTPPDDRDMLWLDMSNESLYVWRKYNGSEWIPASPTSAEQIGGVTEETAGEIAGEIAQEKSENALGVAIQTGLIVTNPIFQKWDGKMPAGYSYISGTVSKETEHTRNGDAALRIKNTSSNAIAGVAMGREAFIDNVSNSQFLTVEADFLSITGVITGAAIVLEWNTTDGKVYASELDIKNVINSATSGKWHTVTGTIKRPAFTGTFSHMTGRILGNKGVGGGLKDIIFDRIAVYETAQEINAEGTNIVSPSSGVSLTSQGLVVSTSDGSSVTTVSKDGVNIKNGAFTLEDNVSNVRQSLDRKTNLLSDHSFELCQYGEVLESPDGKAGRYATIKINKYLDDNSVLGEWRKNLEPRLYVGDTFGHGSKSPFGRQSVAVNANNYVKQVIRADEGETYTASIHAFAPTFSQGAGTQVGNLCVDVKFLLDGKIPSSGPNYQDYSKAFTFNVKNKKYGEGVLERFAATVKAPSPTADGRKFNDFAMQLSFKSTSSAGWIEVDGAQVVKGYIPVLYEQDTEVWKLRRGTDGNEVINAPYSSARLNSLMINKLDTKYYDGSNTVERSFLKQFNSSKYGAAMMLDGGDRTIIGSGDGSKVLTDAFEVGEDRRLSLASMDDIHLFTDLSNGISDKTRYKLSNGYIHTPKGFYGGGKIDGKYNAVAFKGFAASNTSWAIMQQKLVSIPTGGAIQAYVDFTWDEAFTSSAYFAICTPTNSNSVSYNAAIYNLSRTGARIYIRHTDQVAFNGTIQVRVIGVGF